MFGTLTDYDHPIINSQQRLIILNFNTILM
jgi:hypothetical protein